MARNTRRKAPREVNVVVTDLDDEGLGEGTFESHPVRVRNALPGEAVQVRVLKRRRGVWYGEADTPATAAPERRRPACHGFPRCGGCSLQHVDYRAQLEHKEGRLRQALAKAGVVPVRIRAPVAGPQLHYRHKARLGVRVVGDELLAGFREGFSSRVARFDDCKTLALPLVRMLPDLKATLARLSRPDRIPQVELAAGEQGSAVVVRHLTPLDDRDLDALRAFAGRSGICVYLQPGGYDTVAPLDGGKCGAALSYGNPDFGLCYRFLPTDFTQVNPFVNRLLVRNALLALRAPPDSRIVDLFCGIGNFSLALARGGARVLGVESAPGAVARARANARLNGLCGLAEFVVADLYDSRCLELPDADLMLLDPPRSGAGPNLERWVRAPSLQRIAYVSCHPGTFASDAARLVESGFELEEVGVYDMFPHTAHVETLGLFCRRSRMRTGG